MDRIKIVSNQIESNGVVGMSNGVVGMSNGLLVGCCHWVVGFLEMLIISHIVKISKVYPVTRPEKFNKAQNLTTQLIILVSSLGKSLAQNYVLLSNQKVSVQPVRLWQALFFNTISIKLIRWKRSVTVKNRVV